MRDLHLDAVFPSDGEDLVERQIQGVGVASEMGGEDPGGDWAIADFDQAISLDPQLALAYSDRGVANAIKGDVDRAIADLAFQDGRLYVLTHRAERRGGGLTVLDRETGHSILELMHGLNRETGTTFIFSTHDQHVIAMADRVVRMEDGQLRPQSPVEADETAVLAESSL